MSQKLNSAIAVIGIDIGKISLSASNINYLARSISQGNTGGKRREALSFVGSSQRSLLALVPRTSLGTLSVRLEMQRSSRIARHCAAATHFG
jgi:hypothetical protein